MRNPSAQPVFVGQRIFSLQGAFFVGVVCQLRFHTDMSCVIGDIVHEEIPEGEDTPMVAGEEFGIVYRHGQRRRLKQSDDSIVTESVFENGPDPYDVYWDGLELRQAMTMANVEGEGLDPDMLDDEEWRAWRDKVGLLS